MPSTADGKRGRALLAKAGAKPPSAQDAARANAFEAQLSGGRGRGARTPRSSSRRASGKRARELVMQSDFPAIPRTGRGATSRSSTSSARATASPPTWR